MPVRYLFGPVAPNMPTPARQRDECLTFGPDAGSADLIVTTDTTWEALAAVLPAGWRPDVVVLRLPGGRVPPGLWVAPAESERTRRAGAPLAEAAP